VRQLAALTRFRFRVRVSMRKVVAERDFLHAMQAYLAEGS
jgi:hypothetical protein